MKIRIIEEINSTEILPIYYAEELIEDIWSLINNTTTTDSAEKAKELAFNEFLRREEEATKTINVIEILDIGV